MAASDPLQAPAEDAKASIVALKAVGPNASGKGSRRMKDPYHGLSGGDRKVVVLIATAIANGNLLPYNRHSPLAARRVFDALRKASALHCENDRLN